MSDRAPPEASFPPREPTMEEAASNTLFGLALFGIALLVLGLAWPWVSKSFRSWCRFCSGSSGANAWTRKGKPAILRVPFSMRP